MHCMTVSDGQTAILGGKAYFQARNGNGRNAPESGLRLKAWVAPIAFLLALVFHEVMAEEIAASEGISAKWARERKAAILAGRAIDPPHESRWSRRRPVSR
jgi:hypothetical protein